MILELVRRSYGTVVGIICMLSVSMLSIGS